MSRHRTRLPNIDNLKLIQKVKQIELNSRKYAWSKLEQLCVINIQLYGIKNTIQIIKCCGKCIQAVGQYMQHKKSN